MGAAGCASKLRRASTVQFGTPPAVAHPLTRLLFFIKQVRISAIVPRHEAEERDSTRQFQRLTGLVRPARFQLARELPRCPRVVSAAVFAFAKCGVRKIRSPAVSFSSLVLVWFLRLRPVVHLPQERRAWRDTTKRRKWQPSTHKLILLGHRAALPAWKIEWALYFHPNPTGKKRLNVRP